MQSHMYLLLQFLDKIVSIQQPFHPTANKFLRFFSDWVISFAQCSLKVAYYEKKRLKKKNCFSFIFKFIF